MNMVEEAGYERFGMPDVTELVVEAGHQMLGDAVMNPSPRHNGDREFQTCIELACTVLGTMVPW